MCLKPAVLATALALLAAPALAQSDGASPASAPAPTAAPAAAPAQRTLTVAAIKPDATPAAPKPEKATLEQRAEAERLDPLARSAFWAREVDVDPTDADARLKLAKALRALGRYDEAAQAADQLLIMQPDNLEALLESARARIGENQGFYAIDPAQRAAALAPRDWRPQSLLAVALEQADRDPEALQAHIKALQLAPGNPATLTNLGMYYATHGQAAQAEPLLRQAAAAPGAGPQERQNLALVLGMEGRYADAEQLQRQDLPPDQVDNNQAYLRAETDPAPTRSWDALKAAGQSSGSAPVD